VAVILRRRVRFSAADSGRLTGRAAGHDYVCELAVSGDVDPVTGMVVNIKDIDAVMQAHLVSVFHHKLLDRDVPEFLDTPPTLENIALSVWRRVADELPPGCRLACARVWESPVFWAAASPDGQDTMLTVTRVYDFSASHRLHAPSLTDQENQDLFGKCNWPNGHGHNYEIEITLTGELDPKTGELFRPKDLDAIVDQEILKPFDHRHLNHDVPEFQALVPTSENLTIVIWDRLIRRLQGNALGQARLSRVVVKETERNYFEYTGPNGP
jgi:6-pyruvoyltetrahydropterin/6-carboxytetrahydropterin synthase